MTRRVVGLLTLCCGGAAGCSDGIEPPDTTSPGSIVNLAATVSGATVQLTWAQPADPDVAGSLVARFPAAGPDAAPVAGHSYAPGEAIGSGQTVFSGRDTKATDSPPCRQQAYAAWARDAAGNWSVLSETVKVTGLPGSAVPPAPTALQARIDTGTVALSWTNSGTPASVRVVRKQGAPPADASDGQVVFAGTGTSARDALPDLNPLTPSNYAVFACNPCGDCEASGSRASVTPTLMEALRAGGYVIFWRHGTANTCVDQQSLGTAANPQIKDWWKSCDRNCATALARQLDPQGYDEADAIGNGLRARKIPFSRVITSEYCRAVETAAHMSLGPIPETSKDVTFYVYQPADPCTTFPTLVATAPGPGKNVAIVAHVFLGCTDGIASAEAWVYKPDGKGGSTRVARVLASEWATLP